MGNIYVHASGSYQAIVNAKVNTSGGWQQINNIYNKQGVTWVLTWQYMLPPVISSFYGDPSSVAQFDSTFLYPTYSGTSITTQYINGVANPVSSGGNYERAMAFTTTFQLVVGNAAGTVYAYTTVYVF